MAELVDARDSKSRDGNIVPVRVRLPAPFFFEKVSMEQSDCIFCKIIAKEIPSNIITQNDDVVVIQDISPKAPVHYLIIPKKHISDVVSLQEADALLAGKMFLMAKELGSKLSGSKAFRLLVNNGSDVGQSVFHLHCHFLSGKKMTGF